MRCWMWRPSNFATTPLSGPWIGSGSSCARGGDESGAGIREPAALVETPSPPHAHEALQPRVLDLFLRRILHGSRLWIVYLPFQSLPDGSSLRRALPWPRSCLFYAWQCGWHHPRNDRGEEIWASHVIADRV